MKDLVPLCGGWSPRVLPAALTHRPPQLPIQPMPSLGFFP